MMTGEGEFLEEVGLVVSRDAWRRKEIRTNTKHVYQQRKWVSRGCCQGMTSWDWWGQGGASNPGWGVPLDFTGLRARPGTHMACMRGTPLSPSLYIISLPQPSPVMTGMPLPIPVRRHQSKVCPLPRYNLLREESEGWAKLVTLLNQSGAGKVTEANAGAVVSVEDRGRMLPAWPAPHARVCSTTGPTPGQTHGLRLQSQLLRSSATQKGIPRPQLPLPHQHATPLCSLRS